MSDLERAVEKGRLLVGAIVRRDVKTSSYLWELADLSAKHTYPGKGRPRNVGEPDIYSLEEWGEKIGWTRLGNSLKTLRDMIAEARAWPEDTRDPGHTLWQHYEARKAHSGDIEEAAEWLDTRETLDTNITEQARSVSEITGSGPVYRATLEIIKARKAVMRVPAKLAATNILGNEANFPQFRQEITRLRNALDYLDRYIADETVFDSDELDAALSRILAGEEIA